VAGAAKNIELARYLLGWRYEPVPLDFDLGELLISPFESLDQGRHTAIELLLFEGLYPNSRGRLHDFTGTGVRERTNQHRKYVTEIPGERECW